VHWTWQRCGRYEYRKVLMHSTNPTTWFLAWRVGAAGSSG
jgi:hypothetical protein